MYATTASAQDLVNRLQAYGVQHDGEVVTSEYHDGVDYSQEYTLAEVQKAGGKVSRVRILKEGPYADISYIHATLPGGRVVPVRITGGIGHLFRNLKGDFIAWGKEEGFFAKGLGLLDESNWAVLR